MKKNFTLKITINKIGDQFLLKKFSFLIYVLLIVSLVSVNDIKAANFEVDTTEVLPEGDLTDTEILYVKLTPSNNQVESDTIIDAGFALSEASVTQWGDYSCYVRFSNAGGKKPYVDVRDNIASPNMVALDTVYFEMNQEYHVWIQVNLTDQTYTVYIQAPDAEDPVKIAENATFRKTPVSALSYFNCMHNGDHSPAYIEVLELNLTDTIGIATGTPPVSINTTDAESFNFKNFPNPFTNKTNINYHLVQKANVSLTIYNSLGREIETLVNQMQDAGEYQIDFSARNLSSGYYYCKLQVNNHFVTRKMIIQ